MPINTIRYDDTLLTTTASLKPQAPGAPPQEAPRIVLPAIAPSEWALLATTSLCDQQGVIHFFWFWRALRPDERTP